MLFPRFGTAFAGVTRAMVLVLVLVSALPVRAMDTVAKQAMIVDFDTDTVLLEKNADQLMAPSSMSKLMTVYMLFERLKEGSVSLTDQFAVSERAWRMGGSKMFVQIGSRVKVEDLLRGILVDSGNDACVVVAENLAPSEDEFAAEMTKKAPKIGLKNSTFKNATGWPNPEHQMTARDLVILAKRIMSDFPQYYPIFKEMDFTYNGIKQGNRNPLLYHTNLGADGLKTGHTEVGGYSLTASAVRDGRRVIMVLNGMETMKERAQESERLIDWAFREFEDKKLFDANEIVTTADVWLGVMPVVPLVVKNTVKMTLPRRTSKNIKVSAIFNSPIPAPIRKGDRIATLVISAPDMPAMELPLEAGEDIARLGFVGRIGAAAKRMVTGSAH
ncbi:MAG: D-alanyl-D-alanine carboxypeptidase [Alphaproteobacteria bacterium]|nr:D-alanyl-D-alanine carboxypeptidase [Alphaproteobacteria bacterium]